MFYKMHTCLQNPLAQHFNYPESQIRLWVLVNRQNKTVRPDTAIPATPTIRNNMAARQNNLRLYLDVIPDLARPELLNQSIMVFLKHFDTSKQTQPGVGKVYIFIQNRSMIISRPKFEDPYHDHPDFSLMLIKAGEYLGHNPIELRLTTTHSNNGNAKSVLKL
ncbi:hypothetical protein BT96DRAFT_1103041 [Gymnopus androsaceus JB14]|uniref:Ubiquitin carboxyl-terminal hydrolase 7 ICP0-binding domain-containing protein n=1 Tax=Gymnopus androsaceus JB14 TaxID=1447944 RepID=A0A6A4HLI7_9AGAR|nr:hypothetical protein BT96DRAFT_1103041 [Gymnopus androsaceus JB14]